MIDTMHYKLVLPDESHERQYTQMMDKWEAVENDIQPQLLRRYSDSQGKNVSYSKWLEWCEDDRTTGSMLSTGVPCSLYFLVDDSNEIYGAIVINSTRTHMGHLHAGIAPWHRNKGLGTIMLQFALDICRDNGLASVEIVPRKSNTAAIQIILHNGGVLKETFFENEKWSARYVVNLTSSADCTFTAVTKDNVREYKNLRKIFAKYKIQTLRNHGEAPGNKTMFYNLFDSIIESLSEDKAKHFIVMQNKKELLGFAFINTDEQDMLAVSDSYGSVHDFYISPNHRRKGYGRILNEHIESIFTKNNINTVFLHPDPVSGIDFWKAMGYADTGIHHGWGRWLVFCKHLNEHENTAELDKAVQKFVTPTDTIGINPYNKPQLKEVYGVWKEYCKQAGKKLHRNDVRKMAFEARKNRNVSFTALYYQGAIIGFTYKADNEISYVLPAYKDIVL